MGRNIKLADVHIRSGANNLAIKQDAEDVKPLEVMAAEIIKLSKAAQEIANSKLEKRAILLLIRDITKLPLETIDQVLTAAKDLETYFIKKVK